MRFWTPTFFIALTLFFFIHTVVLASADAASCPSVESPQATAVGYQLFTAYQVGFDGYQVPCELKCVANKDCQSQCQTKQALRLLNSKVKELTLADDGVENAPVACKLVARVCLKECKAGSLECLAACGLSSAAVAAKDPSK